MKKEKNHKFKKGDKFTIEIAECHTHWSDDGYPMSLYRIKGFASLVFDDKGLTRLVNQTGANKCEYEKNGNCTLNECMYGDFLFIDDSAFETGKYCLCDDVKQLKDKTVTL